MKINVVFGSQKKFIKGVPKETTIPILFNKFLNDLFFRLKETDICSYFNDASSYACNQNLDQLINRLKHGSFLSITWFDSRSLSLQLYLK